VLWVGMLAAFDNVMGDRANNSYLYLVSLTTHLFDTQYERAGYSQAITLPPRKNEGEDGAAAMPECQAPSSSDRRGTAAQGTDPESLGTLTHQMLKFRAASGFLMAQTYLSTVLLFSGFYLIIYRLDPSSWELSVSDPIIKGGAFTQHVRMFYLSVSSATLCAFHNERDATTDASAASRRPWRYEASGGGMAPPELEPESLVNFVYFASILAQTIGHCGSSETLLERRERLQSISRRLSGRAAAVRSPASVS
ncbi:hypothetical protein HPB47_024130, partial [Ixodes persulcatus]